MAAHSATLLIAFSPRFNTPTCFVLVFALDPHKRFACTSRCTSRETRTCAGKEHDPWGNGRPRPFREQKYTRERRWPDKRGRYKPAPNWRAVRYVPPYRSYPDESCDRKSSAGATSPRKLLLVDALEHRQSSRQSLRQRMMREARARGVMAKRSQTHPHTHSPTHPHTHPPPHSPTQSLSHPHAHSPTQPCTHTPTYSHTHTHARSSTARSHGRLAIREPFWHPFRFQGIAAAID
jgi:hypothetical protein